MNSYRGASFPTSFDEAKELFGNLGQRPDDPAFMWYRIAPETCLTRARPTLDSAIAMSYQGVQAVTFLPDGRLVLNSNNILTESGLRTCNTNTRFDLARRIKLCLPPPVASRVSGDGARSTFEIMGIRFYDLLVLKQMPQSREWAVQQS